MSATTSTSSRRWPLLAALLLVAASAWALKTDKDQPINVQADHGDFRQNSNTKKGVGVYTGHVVITQGSITITADQATLYTDDGELQNADVTGTPATFEQQPDTGDKVHGVASEITYDAGQSLVTLIDNARLTQGIRLMAADHIRYNTDTQHVIANSADTGGRIHITLPPKVQKPALSPAWAPPAGSSVPTSAVPASTVLKPAQAAANSKQPAKPAGTSAPAPAPSTHPPASPLDNANPPP